MDEFILIVLFSWDENIVKYIAFSVPLDDKTKILTR